MLLQDQHPLNKAIMCSVLGAPNVGKSTLINYLLGMDLSIVSHKAQTTRNKFHCVLTVDRTEIVLVDTPGVHKSNKEFNKRLNQQAVEGQEGVDINLLLIDLTKEVIPQFTIFHSIFEKELSRTWVIYTKADLISDIDKLPLEEITQKAKEIIPSIEKHYVVSSKTELNMNKLIGDLCDEAQPGPHLYPGGEISNKNERFFATEYIREQAFKMLKDEIPYEIAVVVDEYKDMKPNEKRPGGIVCFISASILVNRPSQRAIVVGSKGAMIKNIGTEARKKIEDLVGGKVHLNLHVKVTPNWFKNNWVLEEIGIPRAVNSSRVWRQK
ncbi:MAG: GTPase Era [Halobacteriovoraceae bacterium]|nr:GTPase Era [Halobacteriovoraceae bacterium]